MTFYGYIAPVAERVAGFSAADLTWVLVIVGVGLVIGNALGGRTADANLRLYAPRATGASRTQHPAKVATVNSVATRSSLRLFC
jgi:predicted MFS family arabinose efflux permease